MLDVKAFRKAEFVPREMEVTLDALAKAGFGDGKVKVRGLTAHELATAEESADNSKMLMGVAENLAGASKDKLAGLLDGLGLSGDVPQTLARKMCHVQMGVVDPEMDLGDVAKLAETFPIEFGMIARHIYELTGKGQIAQVKPKPSGKTPASKQA
jgi:hypothetical protein